MLSISASLKWNTDTVLEIIKKSGFKFTNNLSDIYLAHMMVNTKYICSQLL